MIDHRISDDDLRQLLETAAAAEPVPDDGVDQVLAARDRLEKPKRSRRPSWPALPKWVPATLLAVGILAGGAVAVGVNSGADRPESASSYGLGEERSSGAASAPAPAAVPLDVQPSAPQPSTAPGPTGTQPRIVQTGSISLTVDDRQSGAALDRLGTVARGLGGYVAQSSAQTGGSGGSATATLRVPGAAFGQAVSQVSGVGRVTRSTTQAEDVTGEYVDLTARIQALQETRASYVRLLATSGTIDETLAVQQEITSVQTQIERLQGQQQVLADRSDLATLTVDVNEPDTTSPTTPSDEGFSGAWRRAVDGFAGGLQWLLAASGPVLLVGLVVLVLFWPARRLVRLLRRRLI